jgi:hypothetical protein
MRESTPRILTGMYCFTGAGYDEPVSVGVSYNVPADRRAQMLYVRAGNSAAEMITLVLTRDGAPMRMFPMGAKGAVHIPLVVVEDLTPDTRLELLVAAPSGTSGTLALDMGLVEI